jgi:hypothetical protein
LQIRTHSIAAIDEIVAEYGELGALFVRTPGIRANQAGTIDTDCLTGPRETIHDNDGKRRFFRRAKDHRMPETTASALRLDFVQEGIARITFDQPGSRANTLNQSVLTELEALLTQLEKQPNLRGLIFCSAKPGMFIAGADLRELASVQPGSVDARGLTLRGLNIIARFEKLPCPTVVLSDGSCVGGGGG